MSSQALSKEDEALAITTIRVTVHTTGKFFEGDTRSGNHASIYLLTNDGQSVRLNMIKAGPADTDGTYRVTRCNYEESRTSLQNFDLQAATGLTVYHVTSMINQKKRHKYKLARSGVGCRFWVKTVVNDMDENNFIDAASPLTAADVGYNLQFNYHRQGEPEYEEIDPGTFV